MNGRRSRPDGRCKKHPKHRQSPGVCSLCLREKLSQLSAASSRGTSTVKGYYSSSSSSSSLSSYYSSSSLGSSLSSPMGRYRNATSVKGSLAFLFSGKNLLTKSRSMAFLSRMSGNNKEGGDDKKKGRGLLSKLLRPRYERTENILVHSGTLRQRMIITG